MASEIVPLVTFYDGFAETLGCGLCFASTCNVDAPDYLCVTLIDYDGEHEAETNVDAIAPAEQFLETVIIHACRYSLWYTSDQIRSAFDIWDL